MRFASGIIISVRSPAADGVVPEAHPGAGPLLVRIEQRNGCRLIKGLAELSRRGRLPTRLPLGRPLVTREASDGAGEGLVGTNPLSGTFLEAD